MAIDTYFIGQRFFGAAPSWHQHITYGSSLVYFCNKCGEIWARILVAGAGGWHVHYYDCPKCGQGTVLTDYAIDQFLDRVASFPLPLLNYEFLRRSQHE
jgi:predicted RNA-binding Zn-ribbon protein involved in translation (DUF1610 family)